jgi:hypothetical protein
MMLARLSAVFFLLVPLVAAQEPKNIPAEVTGVTVSTHAGTEIAIGLNVSGTGSEAEVTATYHDSLSMDVAGAVYRGLPRRISVNAAGVRAVRIWMQSENPPLTRVVVEIDRVEQYLVSTDGNGIVLRVGPVLDRAANASTSNTSEVTGSTTPAAAGRGSASASAVRAFEGIFRHGPRKQTTYNKSKIRDGQPVPQESSESATAESQSAAQDSAPQNMPLPTNTATGSSAQAGEQISSTLDSAPAEKPAGTLSASNPSVESSVKLKPSAPRDVQPASPAISVPGALAVSTNYPPGPPVSVPEAMNAAKNNPRPAEPAGDVASVSAPTQATSADTSKAPEASTGLATLPGTAEAVVSASETAHSGDSESEAPSRKDFSAVPENAVIVPVANAGMRIEFQVKFVEQDSAYLDGGRSSGLTEGMRLIIKNKGSVSGADKSVSDNGAVAELVVVGVAETSAVTEIRTPKRDVVAGDLAYLSSGDLQALVQQNALGTTRKYPAVITFSEGGDALDEEARAEVPRPPLPSVNRASGRFGFDYSGTKSNDASQLSSSSMGAVFLADFTRIGGTYWNLRGYWRGRLISSSVASQQTLQDLINRTYHLSLTYENPNSRWVAGVGRLFLPWASSLDTLDGGYFAGRMAHGFTTGIFGGSTPDPTSWSYSSDRHIGGTFFNNERGSFDGFHFSSTAGFGKSFATVSYSTTTTTGTTQANYQDNRPFAFFENSISYKRTFSVFSAVQADKPSANPAAASPGTGISRSFLTMRFQPFSRIEFSANHTYFRDVPTFDPQLVGTGLLDKYLFQGFSGGARVEVVKNIAVYTDLGRSSRTGDAKSSLNQMYGITFLKIPKLDLRADAHYSRFASSFGSGTYRAFSLSRNLGEGFHVEVLGGDQAFTSSLAGNQSAKFLTMNMDTSLGAMFFLQGGITAYRGQLQNYNQWDVIIGYRFDNKWKHK